MKKIFLLFILFALVSCQSKVEKKDLVFLNGYWEIKKAELPDGSKKDYKVNETIDYISIKDFKGFRQKVMPQFNGKYLTNGNKEFVTLSEEDKHWYLSYTTAYGKWREEIIQLKDSTLVLKNKDQLIYTYKKYKPFSLK